jgi:hypothetical protein
MDMGSRVTISEDYHQYAGRNGVIIDIMNNGNFVVKVEGVFVYPYAFCPPDALSLTTVTVKKIRHHPSAWI